jgi:hypothetical protein
MAAEEPTSPLLPPGGRPTSRNSNRSSRSGWSRASNGALETETTPLLSNRDEDDGPNDESLANGAPTSPATRSLRSIQNGFGESKKGPRRWASILSFSLLSLVVVAILCLGFAAPAIVEEYAQQAVVFEPTKLSIDSFTTTGVRARVQGTFVLDASRVHKKSVSDIGRAGTWIAREIETRESDVKVYLPEYGNVLLGIATVPPVKVNIRNQHVNHIDFLTDLEPGDIDGIRRIANDWLEGRLGSLRVEGVATVPLKSGIFSLGTQRISESILFEGQSLSVLSSIKS